MGVPVVPEVIRAVLRTTAVAALAAFLVGFSAPATSGDGLPAPADRLPACPPDPPGEPGPPAERPGVGPATAPSVHDPAACRARPTRVEPAGAGELPVPRPGYHHLGATTAGEWAGVLGRLTVRDPGVRPGWYDFVATRFLARQDAGAGQVAWLEAGWAETGWSAAGSQRVYAFDSGAMAWLFFDQYPLGDGDRIWISLQREVTGGHPAWYAWLWRDGRWRLLAATDQPIGDRAKLEQYVEVHRDRRAGGGPLPVPPIRVDSVRVRDGDELAGWHRDTVPTVTPAVPAAAAGAGAAGDYCLAWEHPYDAWSAGDCPATVQG